MVSGTNTSTLIIADLAQVETMVGRQLNYVELVSLG